uniref:uncharacterized protein LOC124041623 isoform X2 n=1 Tax=Oncorhynchus gorbuscha TaxID=8017 RepID=UPI001EAF5B1B|nr:uncharacterized protein LOC124041623 isoform X2 [Oncorhynchus gorbuscha]
MVKALPDGLTVDGARLLFGQAPKQNDTGVYEYVANNGVGTRKVEHNITVTGNEWRTEEPLKEEVTEINTLQTGLLHKTQLFQHRSQMTEWVTPPTLLRLDSRMEKKMFLEDHPIYKGSQSTLGGKWGTVCEGDLDYLGRPVLYQSSWRLWPSFLVPRTRMAVCGPQTSPPMLSDLGGQREGVTEGDDWGHRQDMLEVDEADCDTSSYQISKALPNHNNGFLRPKPHSNTILLHPGGQNI